MTSGAPSLATTTAPHRVSVRWRWAWPATPAVFALGLLLLLFVSYPLALLPPGLVSLSYHVRLPALGLLALLAVPALVVARWRPPWWLTAALAVLLASVLLGPGRWAGRWGASLEWLGVALLPLAVAVVARQSRHFRLSRLAAVGFWLWLAQVVHGVCSLAVGWEVTGFPGNRNWMASFLFALAPFAALQIARWLKSPSKKDSLLLIRSWPEAARQGRNPRGFQA